MKKVLAVLLLSLIKAYRVAISPLLPASCRYYPTCSEYAAQAIRVYGPFKGLLLFVRRVIRCHPYHPGGYDPVP